MVSEATLLHRYSFTADASDSIGGLAGTVNGGVTFTGGQAQFPGGALSTNIALPTTIFGWYTSVSIETWVSTTSANTVWNRVFQFGVSASDNIHDTVAISRNGGTGQFDIRYCTASGNCLDTALGPTFASQTNVHVVLTLAVGGFPTVYINGAMVGSSAILMTAFPVVNAFNVGIATEGTTSTSFLYGSVDEIRVWGGLLSPQAISFNYAMGSGSASTFIMVLMQYTPT